MLNHTMIGSNDIQRTKQFYDAVLGVLGAGPAMEHVNDTGQTRLFYITTGQHLAFQSRLTASPQLLLMAPPSVSSATRLSNCKNFTMQLSPMAARPRRIRREYARVPWARCTCAISLTRMATRSAAFTALLNR